MLGAVLSPVPIGPQHLSSNVCWVAVQGADLCRVVMDLLVPLLLSCAAPRNLSSGSPALTDMAVKLITHLAQGTGKGTDTFKVRPSWALCRMTILCRRVLERTPGPMSWAPTIGHS